MNKRVNNNIMYPLKNDYIRSYCLDILKFMNLRLLTDNVQLYYVIIYLVFIFVKHNYY